MCQVYCVNKDASKPNLRMKKSLCDLGVFVARYEAACRVGLPG